MKFFWAFPRCTSLRLKESLLQQRGRAVHYIPDEKSGDAVPITNANPVFKRTIK
jgi:hypothetical protein